jgi:periplasmic protein TonB
MNKKLSGILFAAAILFYGAVMSISYTSCNSDNSNKDTSATPGTDSSNMTKTDTSANQIAATKKVKKGKASADLASPGEKIKIHKDKDGIYTQPQSMPEYPGGESALSQYIESTLEYPQLALDYNKVGTVRVSFVVDENGNVQDPMVLGNKLGDGLDEEALAMVKKMPKWKPGSVKGKNVKTRVSLPIRFQIDQQS